MFSFNELAYASSTTANCRANIRQSDVDFKVTEILPFPPDGEGGHVMLQIEKKDTNTDWLVKQLAKFAGVPEVAVGFAGLKDRHAITTQWLSIKMEGHQEPDWSQFECEQWSIKALSRHKKKLKRGVLKGNQFSLLLTNLEGEKTHWEQNLQRIQQTGVPNYFAEQRFGHGLGNLDKVEHWFVGGKSPKKRHQRSIILSAGRSWIFNQILSRRVKDGTWNKPITGDVMQLAGTRGSFFAAEEGDPQIQARVDSFDIHPTGALWGQGPTTVDSDCLLLEKSVADEWQAWCLGLEKTGLKQERRALRLYPQNMQWEFTDKGLSLQFFLPAGSYATAVLRELAQIKDVSVRNSDTLETSHN